MKVSRIHKVMEFRPEGIFGAIYCV